MEDGRIGDGDITATAHHVDLSAAHYARLNSNKGAGAWCHSSIDKDDRDQYLQVSFNLFRVQIRPLQSSKFNSSGKLIIGLDQAEWPRPGQPNSDTRSTQWPRIGPIASS